MGFDLKPAYAQLRLCVCFFCLARGGVRAEEPESFEAVWARAEERELWNHPEWWTLGHYHRTMWGRVESRIDDPAFFLHPKGKTNRKLELRATLRAFQSPPETLLAEERSLSCRFPARRKWLLTTLDLPGEVFAAEPCVDYIRVRDQLGIDRAAVIYPSSYLNSPASMFGHLLLVLDRKGKDRLLSKAVNYAAIVEDTFGPLFAFKGIFGLYDGVFAVLPYYDKVEEYSAVNRRDIWEYPLDLTEEELDMLLRHVWELQGLKSRYFFFKENCAFNLLYPVEAARPDLRLTRRFRMGAVPVSLLRQLTRTGVTGEPIYRPSKATMMKHLSERLTPEEREHALSLARGRAEPDGSETAAVLTFAQELAQFFYTEQEISPDNYRERVFPLLRARSRLGKSGAPPPAAPPPPDAGHAPRRIGVQAGYEPGEGVFAGLRLRAVYHDWLDDPRGYPPGAAITMFEIEARTRPDTDNPYLSEFTLLEITSLTPPEPWVRPLSWTVSLKAEADPLNRDHHRSLGVFGTGYTLAPTERTRLYGMLSQTLRHDTDLEENLAWEPGLQWGWIRSGGRLRLGLRGSHHTGVLGSSGTRHDLRAEARVPFSVDRSLALAFSHRQERGETIQTLVLSLLQTF